MKKGHAPRKIPLNVSPTDKASIDWLMSHRSTTRSTYRSCWVYFMEFTDMTGDQILVDRKTDTEHKWEVKASEFRTWLAYVLSSHCQLTDKIAGYRNYH